MDMEKPKNSLVIKISENYRIMGFEIEALIEIRSQNKKMGRSNPYEYFPKCLTKGMILFDSTNSLSIEKDVCVSQESLEKSIKEGKKLMAFYVMNQYG